MNKGQSPINLSTNAKYDDSQTFQFDKTYKNVTSPVIKSPYNDSTNQIQVDSQTHGFTSTYGTKLTAPATFNANQFHWHSGSEHTVDDVRMDFEMHTVHFPGAAENGYIAAALGVMFDRENWDRANVTDTQITAIDAFFDSIFQGMNTSTLALAPTEVKYGDLLQAIDTSRRWV